MHFQGLRYLDPVLAAYVGEQVTIRYDPRDLAEIRVFHDETFLCRVICPELAGQTIALKDLLAARNARRRALRQGLRDRTSVVDQLLAVHRSDYNNHPVHGPNVDPEPVELNEPPPPQRSLKLYRED